MAVIGSLGKTTAGRAIAAALDCHDRSFSHNSFSSNLAGNVLRVRPWDKHTAIEVSISAPGQMLKYAKMVRPNIVVVTSVKSDHNGSFATLLETRKEKVQMVSFLPKDGIAILNGDDENVRWMATQTKARIVTFGMSTGNDIRATKVDLNDDGSTNIEVQIAGVTHHFHNPLVGEHMAYPALAAVAVAHVEKMEMAAVFSRLAKVRTAISRMEWVMLPNGIRVLDDSFKSTQESIDTVLDTFAKIPAKRKIVVMGRIEEPIGKARDRYRELGTRLARFSDFLLCVGGNELTSMRAAAVAAGMDASTIKILGSRIEGAAEWLQSILQPGDVVLIKGALPQMLRRILLQLMGKKVSCNLSYCTIKARSCDECPLLNGPKSFYGNYFVSRYIKL